MHWIDKLSNFKQFENANVTELPIFCFLNAILFAGFRPKTEMGWLYVAASAKYSLNVS